jgi:ATP-dependent Lon protease
MTEEDREDVRELLGLLNYPTITREKGSSADSDPDSSLLQVPSHLPILPLRGVVVYPMTAMPLRIGQARSIRLVDDAVTGKRLIGLVTSRDPEMETPGPDDIFRIGTVAAVQRLFKSQDGTITLIAHGLLRIKIEEFTSETPYLTARVSAIPEISGSTPEIEALRRNIIDGFRRLNELSPTVAEEMVTVISDMDDPLQLVYNIADQVKRMELQDAQRLLELDRVT